MRASRRLVALGVFLAVTATVVVLLLTRFLDSSGKGTFRFGEEPAAAAPAGKPASGEILFSAAWGSGPGELGRSPKDTVLPEAPMSFSIGPEGELFVLDQVNRRIVHYGGDGAVQRTLPVSQQAPQDVAVAPDGSLALLDRFGDRTVVIVDAAGTRRATLPLKGKAFQNEEAEPERMPESVTGVFVHGKDVYVEQSRGSVVHLGDLEGNLDAEQREVPGRPSRDGRSFVFATITDKPGGLVLVSSADASTLEQRFTRQLKLGSPVVSIAGLDTDARGVIYLAAYLSSSASTEALEQDSMAGAEADLVLRLVCLSPAGAPLGTADLPVSEIPDDSLRDLQAFPEGGVLFAHRTESGVTYRRHTCR